ncbi:MAG: amidohydrolase family protein [Pseudonocardiales bacterium]|nr:amidohydrolase family protein [Pseudonocardiales bacterium]MBV9031668.1 amidohydrolase family protein [Pseudonocardiales bacterium]MBW0008712.1 amidohydrolase family protein [Pseudonocardiales bacterium]
MGTGAVLVHDVRIFDGVEVIPCGSVLIEDGRIAAVGDLSDALPGTELVDGRGRTLLPGLIDCHTHSFPGTPIQALAFGVTTELDMFSCPSLAATLRAQAAAWDGMADVRSAGTGATAPGGYPWSLVERGVYPPFPTLSRPQEAAGFVRDRVAEGSDYLKVIVEDGSVYRRRLPHLQPEVVAALAAAAHTADRLAVAHVSTRADAALAIEAGVDVLAHAFVDAPADAEFVAAAVRAGVAVVATLAMLEGTCGGGGGRMPAADPRVRPYLDARSLGGLTATEPSDPAGGTAAGTGKAARLAVALESVAALRAAGVPVLAGTDTPNSGTAAGASLHRELELLVQAGLTPTEALAAATAVPARWFGLDGRGRIAPGCQADLLLVDGDPTADILATRSVVSVWRRGTRFDRAAYRRGLQVRTASSR